MMARLMRWIGRIVVFHPWPVVGLSIILTAGLYSHIHYQPDWGAVRGISGGAAKSMNHYVDAA